MFNGLSGATTNVIWPSANSTPRPAEVSASPQSALLDLLRHPRSNQVFDLSAFKELKSLSREADPEILIQGLLGLADRLEHHGQAPAALELYGLVERLGSVTPGLGETAHRHSEALQGRGEGQLRFEHFLQNLVEQATDPAMIAGMAVGGGVFRAARLFGLGRLAGSTLPSFLSRGFGARVLSSVLATALEAPVFTASVRTVNHLMGRSQDWSESALFHEFASAALLMSSLRIGGGISGGILRNLSRDPARMTLGGQALSSVISTGTSLLAIMASHRLEAEWGWRRSSRGWEALGEGLSTLVNLHVGGRVAHGLMGESFRASELALNRRAESLLDNSSGLPRLALASKVEAWRTVLRDAAFAPMWWMMGAGGIGGGYGSRRGIYRSDQSAEANLHEEVFSDPARSAEERVSALRQHLHEATQTRNIETMVFEIQRLSRFLNRLNLGNVSSNKSEAAFALLYLRRQAALSLVALYKRMNRVPGDHSPLLNEISGELQNAMINASRAVHYDSKLGVAMRRMGEDLGWQRLTVGLNWRTGMGLRAVGTLGAIATGATFALSISLLTYFIGTRYFSFGPIAVAKLSTLIGSALSGGLARYFYRDRTLSEPALKSPNETMVQLQTFAGWPSTEGVEGLEARAVRTNMQFTAIVDPEALPVLPEESPRRNKFEVQDDPEDEGWEDRARPFSNGRTGVRVGDFIEDDFEEEVEQPEIQERRSRRNEDHD